MPEANPSAVVSVAGHTGIVMPQHGDISDWGTATSAFVSGPSLSGATETLSGTVYAGQVPYTPPPGSVITAGTSGTGSSTGTITDSAGNKWAIIGGAVSLNGTVNPLLWVGQVTSNVIELAYLNGTMFQNITSGQWYAYSYASNSWLVNPVSNPLTSIITADPGGAGSSAASLTDGAGTTWAISGGQISQNGTIIGGSGVVEMAEVGGVIWQENTAGTWYSWTGSGWSAGTQTSPLGPPAGLGNGSYPLIAATAYPCTITRMDAVLDQGTATVQLVVNGTPSSVFAGVAASATPAGMAGSQAVPAGVPIAVSLTGASASPAPLRLGVSLTAVRS